jgi:LacI family transcriptional regulator
MAHRGAPTGLLRGRQRCGTEMKALSSSHNSTDIPAIGIDNSQASREITEYLLKLGHQRFAIVANTALPNDRSQARLEGILSALSDHAINLAPNGIVEVTLPTIANGRRAFVTLLAANPRLTAILCTTDALAVGALAEARNLGIRIPTDLSVVGFDDVEIAAEVDPPLTTVNVPAVEISRLAADHLVSAIAGNPIPMTTQLVARLIIRESTDRARRSPSTPRDGRKTVSRSRNAEVSKGIGRRVGDA